MCYWWHVGAGLAEYESSVALLPSPWGKTSPATRNVDKPG